LTLSCPQPTYDGGAAISDYKVEYAVGTSNKWTAIKITSSTSSLDVTSLRPNQVYRFRVSAINNAGPGAVSKIVSGTTLVDLPQAPTNLTASKVTSTGSSLAWRAPINTGGARITDYDLETSRDNGANWIKVTKKASTSTSFALTGLDPVTTYLFKVSAVNSKGAGAAVTGSFTTLAVPPGAPAILRSDNITGTTATIAWDAPASNGGSEITNYRVEVSTNCKNYKVLPRIVSNSLAQNVTNLKPGIKYCFRVSAINARGTSPSSTVHELITVGNAPNAPTSLKFTAKATQVTLSWAAATVTGGGPVRDYLVEYSSDEGDTWVEVTKPASTSRSLTIRDLTRSTNYFFRVYAKNDSGTSLASKDLKVTTPAK
jgi:titin